MKGYAHLSWENFRSTVFLPGQQRVHRIETSPGIEFFGDGSTGRIGMWIQVAPTTSIPADVSKLVSITTRIAERHGKLFLEVATAASSLHRQFYHFMLAVAERVLLERRPVLDAVRLELQCFTELLEQKPLLGTEKELGVIGELVFLKHLVGRGGPAMLDGWVGPNGEPHDFRTQNLEFEIKTTVAPRRIHTINGLEQLVPSKDCSLALISVLLGPPGTSAGFSLPDLVKSLGRQFENAGRSTQFTTAVESCGFRESESVYYSRRFILRRPLAVAPVNSSFPAITRPVIQRSLGDGAQRLDSVQYDINIEGLEHEEGTGEFDSAIKVERNEHE